MALPSAARVLAILRLADFAFAGTGSSLPIAKLALRRLKKRRAIAVAQAAAMALAVALPLGLQLVSTVAADAGYQAMVDVHSRDSLVTIEKAGVQNPQSFKDAEARIDAAVEYQTKGLLAQVSEYSRTTSFSIASLNRQSYSSEGLEPISAAYYAEISANARPISGAWPGGAVAGQPIPVAISESGAEMYGLHVGDIACLVSTADFTKNPSEVCVSVAGVYQPSDASAPFWLSGPGSSDVVFSSDGYWQFEQLVQFTHSFAGRAYRPDPSLLTVAHAPQLQQGIVRLRGELQVSEDETVLTSLDRTIGTFLSRTAVNQFPVQLVGVEVIVVVLYGLGFVTQNFLASQEQQAALWRIRGWSRARLSAFLLLQLVFLAVPALAVALVLGTATTWFLAQSHHADVPALVSESVRSLVPALAISAAAMGIVCAALTAVFGARSLGSMRAALTRSGDSSWWQARNVDVLLAVVAIPILVEASLRTQVSVRTATAGADPIGVVLPILGLAMLSVVTLRLLPLLGRAIRPVARGIPGRLSSWRLARQSAEHAGIALVLSLALGVGAFAAVYDRTETTNAVDRADYATGADLRIAFSTLAGPSAIHQELSLVKGARAMTPVLREQVYPSGSSEGITAIGIDPTSFDRTAWSRPGLSTPPLVNSVQHISPALGYRQFDRPFSALTLYVRGLGHPAMLEVDLRDATGTRCTCSFGSVGFSDWRDLSLTPTFARSPVYPLRLYSLEVAPAEPTPGGDIAVSSLAAQYADGSDPALIETFAEPDGWWLKTGDGLIFAAASGVPFWNGAPVLDVPVYGSKPVVINAPPTGNTFPVLMSEATMGRLGLRTGMTADLLVGGRSLLVMVAGAIRDVPTLYPGTDDFIVLPLNAMVATFSTITKEAQTPNEVWLALDENGWSSARGLGPTADVDYVVNRRTAESAALNDPVLIELRAILAMGFASALALAILSFAVHFIIATRRRLSEHAILEANGLDPDDIRRGIAIEQLVLIVFAVVVGLALAGVEVGLLLPSLQLGPLPTDTIPPTVVRVDVVQIATGAVIVTVLIGILGWATRRIATAVDLVGELRRLG